MRTMLFPKGFLPGSTWWRDLFDTMMLTIGLIIILVLLLSFGSWLLDKIHFGLMELDYELGLFRKSLQA